MRTVKGLIFVCILCFPFLAATPAADNNEPSYILMLTDTIHVGGTIDVQNGHGGRLGIAHAGLLHQLRRLISTVPALRILWPDVSFFTCPLTPPRIPPCTPPRISKSNPAPAICPRPQDRESETIRAPFGQVIVRRRAIYS